MACPAFSSTPKRVNGYPRWDVDLPSGEVVLVDQVLVAWADLVAYADSLFPQLQPVGSGLLFVIPATFPGAPNYRARSFTIEPLGSTPRVTNEQALFSGGAPLPVYDAAVFTVTYALPKWDEQQQNDPVPYLRHSASIGVEFMTVGSGDWVWDDGTNEPVPSDTPVGLALPHTTHRVEFPRIFNPPFAAIRSLRGKVNAQNFALRTGVCPPETLLFVGAEYEEERLLGGTTVFQLSYTFEEVAGRWAASDGSPAGWNHFWRDRGAKSGFYRIKRTRGGGYDRPYATGNFNPLFGL